MSHAAPDQPSRRRSSRVDLVLGAVLAVLGVGIAVIAVVALQNPQGREASRVSADVRSASQSRPASSARTASSGRTAPKAPPAPRSAQTSARAAPAATRPVPLVVLNDTRTAGLADTAAARFRGGGWQVTAAQDYSNDILSTCAYYDSSNPANQQAAQQLQQQFPGIQRIKEKFDGLPAGPIVVVLTSDWS